MNINAHVHLVILKTFLRIQFKVDKCVCVCEHILHICMYAYMYYIISFPFRNDLSVLSQTSAKGFNTMSPQSIHRDTILKVSLLQKSTDAKMCWQSAGREYMPCRVVSQTYPQKCFFYVSLLEPVLLWIAFSETVLDISSLVKEKGRKTVMYHSFLCADSLLWSAPAQPQSC